MANLTSSLLVRLIDGVSKPATKAATALRSIGKAATDINGMQSRLNSAIDRNNKALDNARGRMVDAVAAFYTLKSALSAPLDAAMNLETQLEDIGQKANIPQERLGALGKQLRQVARETNQATSKMAQGMDTLVGFGANENDALGLSSQLVEPRPLIVPKLTILLRLALPPWTISRCPLRTSARRSTPWRRPVRKALLSFAIWLNISVARRCLSGLEAKGCSRRR